MSVSIEYARHKETPSHVTNLPRFVGVLHGELVFVPSPSIIFHIFFSPPITTLAGILQTQALKWRRKAPRFFGSSLERPGSMQQHDSKITTQVASLPLISQRFQSLIWTCLDFELIRSAVFYAERYHIMDTDNHDARHLYATALLRSNQTHSALEIVGSVEQTKCTGCLEIRAKCCTILARHRQAREALEVCLQDTGYVPSRR